MVMRRVLLTATWLLGVGLLGCAANVGGQGTFDDDEDDDGVVGPVAGRGGSGVGGRGGTGGTGGTRAEAPRDAASASGPDLRGSDLALGPAPASDAGAEADGSSGSEAGNREGADSGRPDADPIAVPAAIDERAYLKKVVPVLLINVGGATIRKGVKINGTLKVVEEHDGSLNGITSAPATLEVRIGIEGRGNSSWTWYAQKPYGFEVRDAMGNGLAVPLLGMPREPDWVLHSCYSDKTCMRNALTYALARQMGQPGWWAARTRYVEVYIDGRYQGLYLLTEKVKRDRARVVLQVPAKDAASGDLTGGYMISLEGERNKGTNRSWEDVFNPGRYWTYRFPNYRVITSAQRGYIRNSLAGLLRAIDANPRWDDSTKKRVDPQSWIDFFIVQELSNNNDGWGYSFYVRKEHDGIGGRFLLGPIWDVDIGFGNINYNKAYCSNNLLHLTNPNVRRPFRALVRNSAFHNEIRCRYHELRKPGGPLDIAHIEDLLDSFAQHIDRAKRRDQMRWNNIGKYAWPNNFVGASWSDEIRYLKYWIRRRLAYLDRSLPGMCPSVPSPEAVSQISAPTPVANPGARTPLCCGATGSYVPIEGPGCP
jgi:hypothetical protein